MTNREPRPKVVHYQDVPAKTFGDEAPGVKIRLLIDDEHDGAPVYILRMIEVDPGGNTPDHSHPFEHENFVVEGRGEVMVEGRWSQVTEGDVIFVPPGVRHQYRYSDPYGYMLCDPHVFFHTHGVRCEHYPATGSQWLLGLCRHIHVPVGAGYSIQWGIWAEGW